MPRFLLFDRLWCFMVCPPPFLWFPAHLVTWHCSIHIIYLSSDTSFQLLFLFAPKDVQFCCLPNTAPGVLNCTLCMNYFRLLNFGHIETWKCKLCLFCPQWHQCFLRQSWGSLLEDRRMHCMPACTDRGWNSLRKSTTCLGRGPKSGRGVTWKDRKKCEPTWTEVISLVRTRTSACYIGLVGSLVLIPALHNGS